MLKFNKIFIISLLLIAALSLTAVSASEDADANLTSVDGESVEEVVAVDDSADEVQSVEDENVLEDGAGEVLSDKEDSGMNVYIPYEDIIYNQSAKSDDKCYVVVNFPEKVTGTLNYYVDGKFVSNKTITAKTHYFLINDTLSFGKHNYEIKYSGSDVYSEVSKTGGFVITPYRIDGDLEVYYGPSEIYSIYMGDATGDLVAIIDGKRYNAPIIKGHTIFKLPNLSIGTHSVSIEYAGDKNHVAYNGEINSFDVVPIINVPEEIAFNEVNNAEVSLYLPANAKGNLVVYVDDKKIANKSLVNGYAGVSLSDYKHIGNYDIEAYYTGEDYDVNERWTSFRIGPKVNIPSDLFVNTNYVIDFELPSQYSGKLTIESPFFDTIVTNVVNGKASVSFTPKVKDHDEIEVIYEDNGEYEFSQFFSVFVGDNPNMDVKVVSTPGSDPVFTVNVASDATGAFTVLINGNEYESSYFTGGKSLTVGGLADGTYTATVIYSGDNKYPSVTKEVTFTKSTPKVAAVKKVTKITLTLKKVTVKKSAKKLVLTATLKINGKVAKNKKLTFKFNKKTFKAKTNKKGIAKVTVKKSVFKKLKVGKKVKYQVSYGKKTVSKTVKVKK